MTSITKMHGTMNIKSL